MVGAFAVMYYGFARPEVGGFAALMQKPEVISKLNFLPDFKDTDTLVAVFVIPVAIQWWNVWYSGSEPGGGGYIVQRMLTAKTPDHALGGTLFAQIVQYALRPWPWYLTAFASIVLFPDLNSIRAAFPNVDPRLVGNDMAYPAMIKFVPEGWLGIVAASMMGALFSTIAAQISMGANYVANDVWKRFVRTEASDRELVRVARITSVALMVLGCLLVPMLESAKSGFDLMVQIGAGTGVIFLNREVGVGEEPHRLVETDAVHLVTESAAEDLFRLELKRPLGEAELLREFLNADGLLKVVPDILQRLCKNRVPNCGGIG